MQFTRIHLSFCLFVLSANLVVAQEPVLDPLEISEVDFERMSELMRFLRSESNEHLFVPVAKLQLNHLLATAKQLEDEDPERAKQIMTFARGVAFNIASFSWPGWGDQAQPVSMEDQQLGPSGADLRTNRQTNRRPET